MTFIQRGMVVQTLQKPLTMSTYSSHPRFGSDGFCREENPMHNSRHKSTHKCVTFYQSKQSHQAKHFRLTARRFELMTEVSQFLIIVSENDFFNNSTSFSGKARKGEVEVTEDPLCPIEKNPRKFSVGRIDSSRGLAKLFSQHTTSTAQCLSRSTRRT